MSNSVFGPLRVLHVVDSGERRGAEVFASDLVRTLDAAGVAQHVAVVRGKPPFAAEYRTDSTALGAQGKGLPGIHMDIRALSVLRRLSESWGPSLVQTHGGETLKYGILSTERGVPLVARSIGMSPVWATRGPRRLVQTRLLRRAAGIAAVAHAVEAELIQTFRIPKSRVLTIPNGVDPHRIVPRKRREIVRGELGIALDAEVLISICALTWEKDPYAHLEVARQLCERQHRLIHLVVGDGPMRRDLERRSSNLGLAHRVRFLGSRGDAAELLSASDALLFASRSDGMEGMPGVLIEAGMLGIPVAGYDVAGVAEVVEDGRTGLLVPAGDIDALVRAARRLLEEPALRASFGATARGRCGERFAIGPIAQAYLDLYRTLTCRPGHGAPFMSWSKATTRSKGHR